VKELMTSCYEAIIEGRECEVQGWTRAGTLLLSDGSEIEIVPLDQEQVLGGRIWRIARLKCGDWQSEGAQSCLIDGESLFSAINRAKDQTKGLAGQKSRTLSQLFREIEKCYPFKSKGALAYSNPPGGVNRLMRLVGVAWSEDRMSGGHNPFLLPMLLRRFEFLASPKASATASSPLASMSSSATASNQPASAQREYVVGIKAAAKYVGCSRRTISNWTKTLKAEGVMWLPCERVGNKMRFKKADLDKCRKQP